MLHICSGYVTQVSEPWPVGLLSCNAKATHIFFSKQKSMYLPNFKIEIANNFIKFLTIWSRFIKKYIFTFLRCIEV